MRFLRVVGINLLGIALVLVAAEGVARFVEPEQAKSVIPLPLRDPELGWLPRPNAHIRGGGSEFTVDTVTNDLGLYDFPAPPASEHRIPMLALGDSHTAATGVSTGETWPKVLQHDLEHAGTAAWVYNGGVHGYSLDQYLVRFRQLAPILKPRVVIIGFSMATDFYDLGITKAGDFVYGSDLGRIYFSLDDKGQLVEHHELVGKTIKKQDPTATHLDQRSIRDWLNELALYRIAKHSGLAMWLAMRLRPGNESLWPGLDTGLKIELTDDDKYRVALAGKLIGEIATEARRSGAIPVLVHIPYLAQVYDSVWENSFGSVTGYDRDLPSRRLKAFAAQYDLLYADVYPVMREYVTAHGEWVHYKIDSHPNATGQRLIARTIFATLRRCMEKNPELKPDVCH